MGDVRDPERDQVAPTPNDKQPIQDMVIEDILERKEHGIRKYGTPVQAGNGRDMLLDAYEEVMDLAVYLRGALEEGKEFEVESRSYAEYRIIDQNGVTYDVGVRRSIEQVYESLRHGDKLQERYVTTTRRFEWRDELSPSTLTEINRIENNKARNARKRV